VSSTTCSDLALLLEAFSDGEISGGDAVRVREHLQNCATCRRTLRTLAELNMNVGAAPAPAVPGDLPARVRAGLDRAERDLRHATRLRWTPLASAAALLALGAFFFLPRRAEAEMPAIVRASARLHDSYVTGGAAHAAQPDQIDDYFRSVLKAEVVPPQLGGDTCCEGSCLCPLADTKDAVPWILYRRGPIPISLIVVAEGSGPLPDSARRFRNGQPYHAFSCGGNTVLVCRSGKLCPIWIARLPEAELVDLVMKTNEGQQVFSGERISVSGIT